MVPGEYWRGPDRRPEHRPAITTGAARPPERDAEACTTLQITWAGASPRGHRPSPPAVAIVSGFTEGWYELSHAGGGADRVAGRP